MEDGNYAVFIHNFIPDYIEEGKKIIESGRKATDPIRKDWWLLI